MFKEFKKFILRGNAVDLAVGVVIGAAFTSVVNAIVHNIINPLISLMLGEYSFSTASFSVFHTKFMYGAVISALISFIIVATVVFFFVVQPINKLSDLTLGSKKTDEPVEKKCPYCLSTIAKQATRCKFCTAVLKKG